MAVAVRDAGEKGGQAGAASPAGLARGARGAPVAAASAIRTGSRLHLQEERIAGAEMLHRIGDRPPGRVRGRPVTGAGNTAGRSLSGLGVFGLGQALDGRDEAALLYLAWVGEGIAGLELLLGLVEGREVDFRRQTL